MLLTLLGSRKIYSNKNTIGKGLVTGASVAATANIPIKG